MSNRFFLLILLGCSLLSGCDQKDKETVAQPEEKVAPSTVTYEYVPSEQKEEIQQEKVPTTPIISEPLSDVEDAFEEGAAQAEEDRLAGHPGMNYADDYEDDDENEAYEEGYEDE